jgi:antirestriction protein ArdC
MGVPLIREVFIMAEQKTDKFQLVTDKLITLIERGVKPWVKPWSATPYGNLITGQCS